MTGESSVDRSLYWREELAARIAAAFSCVYLLSTPVFFLTMPNTWVRNCLFLVALCCSALAGGPLLLGRPKGTLRSWLLVGPAVLAALAGFATLGFMAGPAVVLTITLVTGGLLLGRGSLLALCLLAVAGLTVIAWAASSGLLPIPDPKHVAFTNPNTWLRTITVMLLASFVLGTLVVDIVSRLEQSLQKLRAQTTLREQAERARANAEIAAHEAKQLETLGRLSAGIAHDFNNSLTAIIGCAELLRNEVPAGARGKKLVDVVIEASERASELTRQLLAYSRKAQMVLKPLDLHQLIEGVLTLLRGSLSSGIHVQLQLSATHRTLNADAALLQSAIVNLLVNARDAMPKGGNLTISTTDHVVRGHGDAFGHSLPAGNYLLLEVLDTGSGIDHETLPKIFEPFFTTKPMGQGTGLGLAAVAGTVRALAGVIDVESELGCGTAFRILLPQYDSHPAKSDEIASQVVRGTGHILLIDDDTVVRATAEATMRMLGYRVTAVEGGAQALELVQASRHAYDLVVLDLRMPHLSGAETFARLHALAPTLPILIWSGYGAEDDVTQLIKAGAAGFVQKPYAVGKLSRTLAAQLATRSRPSGTVHHLPRAIGKT